MNEETKQPVPEEEQTGAEPSSGTEPAAETTAAETEPASEETFTLSKTQMEAAEAAVRELSETKEQLLRLAAEYENYRRRTAKEKESAYQNAKGDTVLAFLAVYDNLERAVTAEGGEDSPHKKGLEMIFTQYCNILEKLGVTKMEAQGQPFDPSFHNAVMHIEDESLGENVVADVLQAGFLMHGKVLRVATVRVAN